MTGNSIRAIVFGSVGVDNWRMAHDPFDYHQDFQAIDFRQHPELYRIGRGEQGVLLVEPYKHEILPHWRFRTPEIARESADAIYGLFLVYKAVGDFVGMDMARKFLQMGYTRARRYANHKGGRKYDPETRRELPRRADPLKAAAAREFYPLWRQAREDPVYLSLKALHIERKAAYFNSPPPNAE